jgi:hypothetical protein
MLQEAQYYILKDLEAQIQELINLSADIYLNLPAELQEMTLSISCPKASFLSAHFCRRTANPTSCNILLSG